LGFSVVTLAWANATPFLHRLSRGEGLLLAVNASIILSARPDLPTFLAQISVSALVLTLLYFFNDVHDCRDDINDSGKNQALVTFCVQHRARLYRLLALEHALVLLVALTLLGQRSALAVAAVFAVNVAYSTVFKRLPVIDVPFVFLWGATYAMVPGTTTPLAVVALVGVMTSICHVFQISRDRKVDAVNGVRTSAGGSSWLPVLQMAASGVAMAALLYAQLGAVAAATAAIPLVLRWTLPNQAAWLLSKAYYAVIWLVVLGALDVP
jgi:hypothetical protein